LCAPKSQRAAARNRAIRDPAGAATNIEQLKSLNEEQQSSNEELQAANEELENFKGKELQSLNEELILSMHSSSPRSRNRKRRTTI